MSHAYTYGSMCSGIEAATVAWAPPPLRAIAEADLDSVPEELAVAA